MLGNTIALIAVAAMFGVEAYKAPDRLVRIILTTLTVVFAMSGLLLQQISTHWPQTGAFIAGIFAAPSSWFVLLIGLFFVLRPYWTKVEGQAPFLAKPYDDTKLRAEVADLAKTVRAVIDDYQRMSGVEIRVTDALDAFKLSVRDEFETVRMGLAVVERKANEGADLAAKLEAVRVDGAIATKNIEKLEVGLEKEGNQRRFSLYTIHARERLAELVAIMRQDERDLYDRLSGGEVYDAEKWKQWENVHAHWQTALHSWIELAQWYAPKGVVHAITNVTDAQYAQQWTVADNQFPSIEAGRRFRKHRIVLSQWDDIQPQIMANVVNGAFCGMAEEDLRRA